MDLRLWFRLILRRLHLSALGNKKGLVESIAIGAIGLSVATGVIFLASRFMAGNKVVENKKIASAENEMVMSRVSHAIAMNAIQCAAPLAGVRNEPMCWWTSNSNLREEDFGLDPVSRTPQRKLNIVANACIPKAGSNPSANECKPSKVDLALEMINIGGLRLSGLIGGNSNSGDSDPWGIKITTHTEFISDKVDSETHNLKKEIKESVAIIRRPRMFLRFEVGAAVCERQCELTNSVRDLSKPCIGMTEVSTETGSSTGMTIPVKVFNDGPGHIYRFQVKRTFIPNPEFSSESPYTDVVYDSKDGKPNGLASGESVEFVDTGGKCYINTMFNTVESTSQTGTSTSMQVSRKISGRVQYQFVATPDYLDPANVLLMGTGDASVQAQERTVTTFVEPPPPPPPDPCSISWCGGGGCGDGGGGGGGCGGGADGY